MIPAVVLGVLKVFQTPTPPDLSIGGSITALTDLGVLPVITIAAVVGIAAMLYRRFKR